MSNVDLNPEALARRLDALESDIAIRQLASNYCHGFDKRDRQLFMAIWWEDCVWDIGPPFGRFDGHSGVQEALESVLWPAWEESHHLCANHVVTFEGVDDARAVCDVDCVGKLAGDAECQIVGATYTDALQRRGGEWKILRRDVVIHYFNPVPGAVLTAPGES